MVPPLIHPRIASASPNLVAIRNHGGPHISADAPTVRMTFINPHPSKAKSKTAVDESEEQITVDARIGETLLQTAHRHHIDLEGACEGVCACSTCHLILPDHAFDEIPEASEDEEDMLGEF